MKTYEKLAYELEGLGVRMDAVRINLTPLDNTYCILNYGDEIEVFYSERGAKFDLKEFVSDEEAIDYFKKLVLSDQSVFKDFDGTIK